MRDEAQNRIGPLRLILHPSSFIPLLAFLLYLPALEATYVYDDVDVVLNNDRLVGMGGWGRILTESYNDGADNLYRPLATATLAIQASTTGRGEGFGGAVWFHLVNVLLYALVCGQAAVLARRVVGGAAGVMAAVLFAVHPVHAEAVVAVVGRADLLCAIGFLGGLLVVTNGRPMTPGRILATLACFAIAVASKETGLVFPAVVAAFWVAAGFIPARREPDGNSAGMNPAPTGGKSLAAALLLTTAAYVALREQSPLRFSWAREMLDPTIQPIVTAAGADRWLLPLVILGHAGRLLVLPLTLSIDYGAAVIAPPVSPGDPHLWIGVAVAVASVVALVHAWRSRWPAGVFCLLAALATWGPVSNTVTVIGTVFGERLLFLPSLFLLLYAAALARRSALKPPVAAGGLIAAALIAALLMVRTGTYAARWHDRLAFYAYQTHVQPRSVMAHRLLSREALVRGDAPLAADAAARATGLAPDYWNAWIDRADAAIALGDYDAAVAHAERAKAIKTFLPTVAAVRRANAARSAAGG